MKKFMKFLAVVSCCVMVFAMTAFAAKSPSAGDNSATQTEKDMAAGVTANDTTYNGQKIQIIVTPTKEVYIKGAEEAAQKLLGSTAKVLKTFDATAEPNGDFSAGVDVTFNVAEIKEGMSVSVLHMKADGNWENLKVTNVSNGSVTATFTSFSPVAIVINAAAPGTGYQAPVALIAAIVACLACAVVCFRKRVSK